MNQYAYEVAHLVIHLNSIDFINIGDGTSYNPPRVVLKSGQILDIYGDYQGYSKLLEAYKQYDTSGNDTREG